VTDFPDRIGIGGGPMVPCRIIGMDFTPETGHTFVSGTREPDGTFRLDQVTYEGEIQGPVFPEGQTAVERMAALLDHYGVAPPAELVEAVDEDRRRVDAQTLGDLPPDCVIELEADAGTLYAALRRAGEAARQLAAGFQPMFDAVGRVGRSVGAIRSALDPELIEGRDWPAESAVCCHVCGPDPGHTCDACATTSITHPLPSGGRRVLPLCGPCHHAETAEVPVA
jgi:hypothetical protein